MEKKMYEKPLLDVIEIEGDVITASGGCDKDECRVVAVPCDAVPCDVAPCQMMR